jgi:hypothetical protein
VRLIGSPVIGFLRSPTGTSVIPASAADAEEEAAAKAAAFAGEQVEADVLGQRTADFRDLTCSMTCSGVADLRRLITLVPVPT